jgi:multiple sugar transport system permease protein
MASQEIIPAVRRGKTRAREASERPRAPGRMRGSYWLDRQFTALTALPTTLMMLAIFGIPLLFSLYISLRGWSIEQSLFAGRFVGLANYIDLITDFQFVTSLVVTLCYTVAVVTVEMALGLAIALALNVDLPFIGFFRTILVVPMMMTPIVAAFCWRLLLDPSNGIINYWIGQHIVWLGQPGTARLSVAVVNVWQNAPYVAILLLAGLRSLPSEPLEAASIDGAGRIQTFWHVTVPLLRSYLLVALLLRTIFEFRSFDNVYVMTSGGPANATMVLSMFTYLASFQRFDLSLGSAASWIMLLISLLLCAIFIMVVRRESTR